MSDKARPLATVRVLVLEDDYYLATDLQEALQSAGATVVGPFADAAGACRALVESPPDCALVDVNLGDGPCFALPRALTRAAVPFAFLTGYDRSAIPEEFASTPRLEKPVEVKKVVQTMVRLIQDR